MASATSGDACRDSSQAGFTLIEATIVVIIIAVVVGALTPSVVRQLEHARTNRAANVVAAEFFQAQTTAGRQRTPVALSFDATAKTLTVSAPASGTTLAVRRFGLESEFKLTTFSATPSSVLVLPTGMASATVTVTVGTADYSRRTVMTRAGMIRVR